MKKLLFGIFVTVAIFSCKPKPKLMPLLTQAGSGHVDVQESLNGVPILAADTMIASFIKSQDNSPNNTQIWFDKSVLDSIFTLFASDSLSGITKPDGIRIYFSRAAPPAGVPTHSSTGIILVSTYYAGSRIDPVTNQLVQIHSDYYTHAASAGLFKLSPAILSGTTYHDTNDVNGALLYDSCNCDAKPDTISPHSILRSQAEKMAKSFRGKPFNAYSEWFDISMFKYLKNYLDSYGDGLRIYFAKGYDGNNKRTIVNKFVITTTKNNGSGPSGMIHQDNLTGIFIQPAMARKAGKNSNPQSGNDSIVTDSSSNPSGGKTGAPPPPPQETGEDCPTHC